MVAIADLRKLGAHFFLLTYLLIGTGLGSALLWCQESEAFSHLELNLSGTCQNLCPPGTDQTTDQQSDRFKLSPLSGNDCLDTPLALSHARQKTAQTPKPAVTAAGSPVVPTGATPPHNAGALTRMNRVAQPPPPQSWLALRTTILLI